MVTTSHKPGALPKSDTLVQPPITAAVDEDRQDQQVGATLRTDAAKRPTDPEVGSSQLVEIVRKIPVVALTLQKMVPQGMTVGSFLHGLLANYDAHLARQNSGADDRRINESMRLAGILTTVAGSIARSAGDPSIKSVIATELGRVFRGQLMEGLKGEGGTTKRHREALDLAMVLVSEDPISLFVGNKIRREDAAWAVRRLGDKAHRPHAEMFQLLREQFELQLGSHTLSGAQQGQLGKDAIEEKEANGGVKVGQGGFDLEALIGEVPPALLTKTTKMDGDAPAWKAGGLDLTTGGAAKLDDLRLAVLDPGLTSVTLSASDLAAERTKSGTTLTVAQSTHFHRLREDEKGDKADYEGSGKDIDRWARDALKGRYNLSDDAAVDTLIGDIVTQIGAAPLTLTQNLDQLFSERADKAAAPAWGTSYEPELKRALTHKNASDMLMFDPKTQNVPDKQVEMLGVPHQEGMQARGRNYVRWRAEKDERETGMHSLPHADKPTFAAVNPTFDATMGASMNKATRDKDGYAEGANHGTNYYGDFHMKLNQNVRSRATLIARGSKNKEGRRVERVDLKLLLADLMRIGDWDYVDSFVQLAKGFNERLLTTMNLEIHIYGNVDLGRDVTDMYLQPAAFAATDGAGKRAKDFAHANGIAAHDVGVPPLGYKVKTAVNTSTLTNIPDKAGYLDLRKNFGTKP